MTGMVATASTSSALIVVALPDETPGIGTSLVATTAVGTMEAALRKVGTPTAAVAGTIEALTCVALVKVTDPTADAAATAVAVTRAPATTPISGTEAAVATRGPTAPAPRRAPGVGMDAAERPAGTTGNGFMGYDREFLWSKLPEFLDTIRPHIHRVTKSQVLDLPPLTFRIERVPLLGEPEAHEALSAAAAAWGRGRGAWPTMTVAAARTGERVGRRC